MEGVGVGAGGAQGAATGLRFNKTSASASTQKSKSRAKTWSRTDVRERKDTQSSRRSALSRPSLRRGGSTYRPSVKRWGGGPPAVWCIARSPGTTGNLNKGVPGLFPLTCSCWEAAADWASSWTGWAAPSWRRAGTSGQSAPWPGASWGSS